MSLEFGVYAVAGKRKRMEDRHSSQIIQVEVPNGKETLGMFAVYDGHGGDFAVVEIYYNIVATNQPCPF